MRSAGLLLAIAMLICALLGGCRKQPEGVLSQEDLAQVLADLHMADGVTALNYSQFPDDSSRQALKQSVLMTHGVSQQQLDTSFIWYGKNLDMYMEVCDRVIEILEERQSNIAAGASSQIAIAGDSVELWNSVTHIIGTPRMLSKILTFNINPDTNWHPGDIYTLRYKVINSRNRVASRILADYSDGTTSYRDEPGLSQGWVTAKLQLDSTRTPQRVYGYIIIDPEKRDYFHIDSLSLVRTRKESHPNAFFPHRSFNFGLTEKETADSSTTIADALPNLEATDSLPTNDDPSIRKPNTPKRVIPARSARRI